MKLPRRDVPPHLRRRRHPHPGRRRPGCRCPVLGHQHAPRPERVGAGHPLLDDRRDQGFQHLPGAAQAQVRDPSVRGSNRRVRRHEIRGVVVGAQQRGQPLDELLGAAAPRHAVGGVGARAADPGRDGSAGQQAGPPDGAVSGEPKARVPRTAAQRRQRVPEADRPGKRDRARAVHLNNSSSSPPSLTAIYLPRQYCDVMTPFDDPQAELAWMFLQSLSEGGDLDEGFALLSDDFTYWSIFTRTSFDKQTLRRAIEQRKQLLEVTIDLIRCRQRRRHRGGGGARRRHHRRRRPLRQPVRVHLRDPRRPDRLDARIQRHPGRPRRCFPGSASRRRR